MVRSSWLDQHLHSVQVRLDSKACQRVSLGRLGVALSRHISYTLVDERSPSIRESNQHVSKTSHRALGGGMERSSWLDQCLRPAQPRLDSNVSVSFPWGRRGGFESPQDLHTG